MPSRNPEVWRKVTQWLQYADEDFQLAYHGMSLGEKSPHRLIAYHAQQGAEKYLKAYLVFHEVDFPFTHNIARLLELCAELPHWKHPLTQAEELTPYAVTARYPGVDFSVSLPEASKALKTAEEVRSVIKSSLIKEGLVL